MSTSEDTWAGEPESPWLAWSSGEDLEAQRSWGPLPLTAGRWQGWGSPATDSRTQETLHLAGPSLCSLADAGGRERTSPGPGPDHPWREMNFKMHFWMNHWARKPRKLPTSAEGSVLLTPL